MKSVEIVFCSIRTNDNLFSHIPHSTSFYLYRGFFVTQCTVCNIFEIIEDDVMTLLRPQGLFQLGEFMHMERNFF